MDAEARKKELMSQNKISDGMMFKLDFDPRIIGNKVLPDGRKKDRDRTIHQKNKPG